MGNKKQFFFVVIIMLINFSLVTEASQSPISNKETVLKIAATASEAQHPQTSEQKAPPIKVGSNSIYISIKNSANSSATDQVIFYMARDMETNKILEEPETVQVILTLKEGSEAIPDLHISSSKEEITISNVSGNNLTLNNPVSFDVDFWSDGLADGSLSMVKGDIEILNSNQEQLMRIPVIASADALFSYYNSEIASTFTGSLFNNDSYCNIGKIDLNLTNAGVITVKHQWKPIAASETYRLRLIQLDPNGYFEFPGGGYEREAQLRSDGYVEFQIHMKESVFKEIKAKAVSQDRNIYQHVPLSELVFIYEGPTGNADGFMIGGKGSSLPITYLITYTAYSSGSGGGGSSGGGGGGSTTIVDTFNYNVAREQDKGWKLVDDVWYYYDSNNKLVKGWLLSLDGKWYYMDKDGKMMTGWVKPQDGKWYYLQENGVMLTGWYKTEEGKQYYLQGNGVMVTGWFKDIDEKWYYFLTNGEMSKNVTTPDGYYINEEGIYIP